MYPSNLPRKRKRAPPKGLPKGGDYLRDQRSHRSFGDDDDGGDEEVDEDEDGDDDGGDDAGRKSRRRLDDNDGNNDSGNNLDREVGNRTYPAQRPTSANVGSAARASGTTTTTTTTTSTRSSPRPAARLRAVAASSSSGAASAGRAHAPGAVERRTNGGTFLARMRRDDDGSRRATMVAVDDDVVLSSNVDIPRIDGGGTYDEPPPVALLPTRSFSHRGRGGMHPILLSFAVACIVAMCSIVALIATIAVAYANTYEHEYAILRMEAIAHDISIESNEARSREAYEHVVTRAELRAALIRLDESRDEAMRLREGMRSDANAREVENRDRDASMRALTAHLNEYASSKDEAWSRLRELSEENGDLKRALAESERMRDASRSREARLADDVEDLTRRMDAASRDGDELTRRIDALRAEANDASARCDVLRRDHEGMSDSFLSPILAYVAGLQLSSDRQHSIILDLTSLVHSLRASLEVDRDDSMMRASMSIHAVDAVAHANGQLAIERARTHELERAEYMKRMEMRLVMLEDEALGAVVAVAEAAGRLEYERKVEEEGRWRDYTMETESILRSVRDESVVEDERRDSVGDGGGGSEESVRTGGISSETSLLRAAISRRIEEGMASLRSYYHPTNYLTKGGVIVKTITSESDIVNGIHSGGTSGDGEVHEDS
jgi:hypothetical protein